MFAAAFVLFPGTNNECCAIWDQFVDLSKCQTFQYNLQEDFKNMTILKVIHDGIKPVTQADTEHLIDFLEDSFSLTPGFSNLTSKIEDFNLWNLEVSDDTIDGLSDIDLFFRKRRETRTNQNQKTLRFKRDTAPVNNQNGFVFNDFIYYIKEFELILQNNRLWESFNSDDKKVTYTDKLISLIRNLAVYLVHRDLVIEGRNMTDYTKAPKVFPDTDFELIDENLIQIEYYIADRRNTCYELEVKARP